MIAFLFGFYVAISLIIGFIAAIATWLPDNQNFNKAVFDLVCCTVGFAVVWPLVWLVVIFDKK